MTVHEPQPVPGTEKLGVTLCSVCLEKLRSVGDNEWEHFGVGKPYEPLAEQGDQ